MPVDINTLSRDELIALRYAIDKRLEHLNSLGADERKLHFAAGDAVCFTHARYGRQEGIISRHNEKTTTVIKSSGQQWNVSPHLLRKLPTIPRSSSGKIIVFPRNTKTEKKR